MWCLSVWFAPSLLHPQPLLSKAVKYEERLNDLAAARSMLARLQDVPVDKCWRTLLEGAQLEARAGESRGARMVFNFLMDQVRQSAGAAGAKLTLVMVM